MDIPIKISCNQNLKFLSPPDDSIEPVRNSDEMVMIEVIANDRLGKKVRIKCDSEDTVGDLKVFYLCPRCADCRN
jgi:hypothetical protein